MAAVSEAKLKAVAKLEDLDTSLTLAVSRARYYVLSDRVVNLAGKIMTLQKDL